MAEREVKIKITAIDGTSKTVNLIADALARLQKEVNSNSGSTTDKTASSKTASYNAAIKDIDKLRQQNLRAEKIIAAEIGRTDTLTANYKIKEAKRSANALIAELKQIEREKKAAAAKPGSSNAFAGDLFSTVFGAATLAGLVTNAVSSILSGITSGISAGFDQAVSAGVTAAKFERSKIALAGVLGSAALANIEIAKLEKTAQNTKGLTFQTAIDGYLRLRAVQFGAQDAERALIGLSKVKILSGGTKQDLEAVLINFAQIRSMGKLTGDELRETLGRLPFFAQVLEKAFGTISTEKIGELGLSSNEFFKRIFDEFDKIPPAAGGATEAFDKLVDEFFKAQIAFGTPLLEPVTESLIELTEWVRENKDTWADWGQLVGDCVRGASAEIK
ncbi:MAG: tape measure protein [Pyrinomonadaceae bacterium]|nr:tape measure protein [Pyrinomonadaceae bacterium]